MADLREARRRLEEIKRKQEEAAANVRKLEVQPKMEVIESVLIKDKNFCENISGLAKDDLKIFARIIVESFDELFQKAEPEIEVSRLKRKEKLERQKARRKLKTEAKPEEKMQDFSEQNDDDEVPSIEEYENDSLTETGTVYGNNY